MAPCFIRMSSCRADGETFKIRIKSGHLVAVSAPLLGINWAKKARFWRSLFTGWYMGVFDKLFICIGLLEYGGREMVILEGGGVG